MSVPTCFDSEGEFLTWLELARHTKMGDQLPSICNDCTPDYQADMIAQHCCASPRTSFALDNDGGFVGHPPRKLAASK